MRVVCIDEINKGRKASSREPHTEGRRKRARQRVTRDCCINRKGGESSIYLISFSALFGRRGREGDDSLFICDDRLFVGGGLGREEEEAGKEENEEEGEVEELPTSQMG
jgi:hypothetical protein